jgi:hypothetical protein
MPAVRGAFDKVIAPGAYAAYADEYEQLPAEYPEVVNVLTTERAYEDAIITASLGTTPVKPEGQDVALDRPFQVGSVRMLVVSYGLGYEVSKELMDDDLYGVVADPSSRFLAQSGRDTEERQAWAMYNNAFTSQQAYDGVSLINSAHPLVAGGTGSNAPASAQAFGFTALQASIERMRQLTNERQLKIRMVPQLVIVPIPLEWLADEILLSAKKPHEATNTENVLAAGRIGLTRFTSHYLTSTTAWYTSAGKGKHKLNFFWREKPNMDRDFDKKARVAIFMNFFRFGTAAFDWRGVDGSTG